MGTPVFAGAILEKLIEVGYDVVLVVSQPDKKLGRKQILEATAVKQVAMKHGIDVFQPIRIKDDFQSVLDTHCDLIVTCAYGQMIPEAVLEYPVYGSLNVHASLLPRLRGGAPIQKAIMYGEQETGISIMRMVKQMDAGAYMLQKSIPIDELDTYGSLHDKLIDVAQRAIIEAIPLLLNGEATFIQQEEQAATYAYNISKEEECLDLTKSSKQVYNHIRSLLPIPASYILFANKKLKIHGALPPIKASGLQVGSLYYQNNQLFLACIDGLIELIKVQVEGKNVMEAKAFMNGFKDRLVAYES